VTYQVSSLQAAVETTLAAIEDGRQQAQLIVEKTWEEVQRLEVEYEEVKAQCVDAIEQVERTDRQSRVAREQLMVVNRELNQFSEAQMRQAYEKAQHLQIELGQWQEREVQLRFRRDDLARRLKSLRATAHEAETLILKFTHITDYLSNEFHDLTNVLQSAQMESLVALQVLQMQEDERRVLAQRLHDGPMQSLAGTAMKAQLVPVVPEHEIIKEQVRQQLNAVIGDIRQIVFDLRPPLLDDLGLIPALKRYVQQWSEWNHLTVRTQLVGVEVMLRPTEKMTVFRVAQEVLQNIAQHAEATQVDIELTYGVDSLTVEIQDDGEGVKEVNWLTWINTGRLGLTMSRQRLSMLKGTLDLARTEPSGTKVTIGLPITRSEQNHVAGNHSDRHSG
jgi:two-component system, NarL family, sensor histidine kinase DegS